MKVYLLAFDPVKAAEKKAVALAEKKVSFSNVQDFHIYNGIETVYVIEGKNKKGEKIIVWIPEKNKQVIVKKANSAYPNRRLSKNLKNEKSEKDCFCSS